MRIFVVSTSMFAALLGISGCAVVSVGGAAVSVATTAVTTTAKVGTSIVGGAVDLAIPDSDDDE
ncbi:hypothetical protein PsAD2_01840 [Pseudovibrio axinellae]|uniref:Lipoprotein n=1 Tax=Pseudovibrio axinellae TaxID=989403 RepID=A0A165Z6T5_9HYPH|nr:hypothetical protein [Pseudovibrio axinellae]KZL19561.1 hypothetical protein PsAD2_01840 [Pseudovibrio axinellae]SEQ32048.1 hypothetical protein SAMN05421798_102401 [Pseudovibrio axinellae]